MILNNEKIKELAADIPKVSIPVSYTHLDVYKRQHLTPIDQIRPVLLLHSIRLQGKAI